RNCIGAIQNVGVIPEHRCKGLGRSLVLQALHGFRFSGMHHGVLEVTSENRIAVNLYESMGFEICEVLYRNSSTGEVVSELPE
ncbi:MAG: GNAT family N-acetyltransferase, partial [Planctomycetaceae bacterium]|nr:GNAT family N-acetyltransferase [Planctomycetaceae bacterium]